MAQHVLGDRDAVLRLVRQREEDVEPVRGKGHQGVYTTPDTLWFDGFDYPLHGFGPSDRPVSTSLARVNSTTRSPLTAGAARCSTLKGPFGVCQTVATAWRRTLMSAVTSVAYQSFSGDHEKICKWPDESFAARCSKLTGRHFLFCQLATSPVTRTPVFAVTSTTCQSCAGDQKNTSSWPFGLVAARCSTFSGPFGVCQLVAGPATFAPAMLETFTASQSCVGAQWNNMRSPLGLGA